MSATEVYEGLAEMEEVLHVNKAAECGLCVFAKRGTRLGLRECGVQDELTPALIGGRKW
jgi:hypothetical protein